MTRRGYTAVELIVATGVFTTLSAVAVGGFVTAMRSQRQVTGLLVANSTASLMLEQMAREVRTGRDFCLPSAGNSCVSGAPGDYANLVFTNAVNQRITYVVSGGIVSRAVGFAAPEPVTGANANIAYMNFRIIGNSPTDGYPPRITIFMGVGSREPSILPNIIRMQTTVSARLIDG